MPEVKFTNVVTFSSEDPVFKAENLLSSTSKVKKWRSATEGESQLTATLQMEKPVQIQTIDIGNDGSAFVEIQVGRKGSLNQNDNFHVLLGAASFMSPLESRNDQNLNRVRMFNADKLNSEVAKQNWDQIRVVCTQPFNKHVKYGLSFIKVHSADTTPKDAVQLNSPKKKLGAFTLRDEEDDILMSPVSVGGLFASRFKATPEENKSKDSGAMSMAASIRSDATLASIVLSQEQTNRKRKMLRDDNTTGSAARKTPSQDSANNFYQLKQPKDGGNPVKRQKKNLDDDTPLPRRDILPGEKTKVPKDAKLPESKKKIKVVRPRSPPAASSPRPEKAKLAPPPVRSNKPFNRLLEGVFFAISGYQNPLRGQIRELGMELGARYRPDWDTACTHLICAFPNTPKFRDVKSLGGKIVKREWLEMCHADRKRYPWRRFCLDNADKGQQESDEEVWATDLLPSTSTPASTSTIKEEELDTDEEIERLQAQAKAQTDIKVKKSPSTTEYDMDTDEEIEILKEEKQKADAKTKNNSVNAEYDMDTDEEIEKLMVESPVKTEAQTERKVKVESEFDMDTDEEIDQIKREKTETEIDSDEAYEAETDVDEENEPSSSQREKKSKEKSEERTEKERRNKDKSEEQTDNEKRNKESLNGSSSFFKGKTFLIYGPFDLKERLNLTRIISSYGGNLIPFLKSGSPDFVVTRENWDRNFDRVCLKCGGVKFVRPEFVFDCANESCLLDARKYKVTPQD